MFQNLIGRLKQLNLLTPSALVFALLFVLSLIIIIGQFFHQTLQNEMAEQFNKQQLLLAREVAINIESFIDGVYKDIHIISQLPEIHRIHQSPRCRIVAEAINMNIRSNMLVTIRVLDKNGIMLYDSANPGREGLDLSKTAYFRRATVLPRNERLITDLLDIHDHQPETKEFIVATAIYQDLGQTHVPQFNGAVLAVLSLDAITQNYLSPIKSGTRGYAWMMDSDGTLLYHPTQPMMVGKNLFQTDRSCFDCHRSFDTEKKMIEGETESFGNYQAPGGENKLMAFYRIPLGHKSWLVAVSAPYSDVIALMQKSRQFYSLLIISIFVATLAASGVTIITNKKKIEAEQKARHLENQRRLEREIEIAKNYLENIVENTKTNLMVLDREFIVKTLNTAQARTLGRPKEDILGRPFFYLFPDVLEAYEGVPFVALLQKTLGGRSFEIKDYKITGIQSAPIYLDMNISPLLIEGEITGILITSTNVTKRVQLEEALKQYTVELEVKVDKETATTRKLEQQVLHSEKLAALGRLAAGVAHEIGNPLTSISTFAQLLREMAADEFTQSSLDIINNHIQRITEIVRQMSTFSRPDAMHIKSHQINDILKSSLDLMRLDKRMKNTIEIAMDLDGDLPGSMIDEGQIAQVFINIILNALDAMPEGGKLTVSTGRGTNDQGRDAIFVEFTDTGIGIPEKDLEKIFDPFYTTKEAGKGTGLGLAVSYNIVKRFKGDIKVKSEEGKGTTFTVILPVEKE
jgi:PAS domain S-box-containing protein